MNSFDVIVAGGGPAGAVSALKCAQEGYNTLLLEKGRAGRHKPCGGIAPTLCADMMAEELGLKLPAGVMCSPGTLGLFYVPPSGRERGGSLRNYRLLNLNRALFDQWLRQAAEDSGVKILYETELQSFRNERPVRVVAKREEGLIELESAYLIGADGVFSRVRKQLHPDIMVETMSILQEHWEARGDFGGYFYSILKEAITPSYAYLIPKDGLFVIGTGVTQGYPVSSSECLERFKGLLRQEFAFEPVSLEKKERGAIPYNSLFNGDGEIILIGDAAGFCNPFSGEGIRLAIESGILAGEAVAQANHSGSSLSFIYASQFEALSGFIRRTYKFSVGMTDDSREKFVSTELKRVSLSQYQHS